MIDVLDRRQVICGGAAIVVPWPSCACAQEHDSSGCWMGEDQTEVFTNSNAHGRNLAQEYVTVSGLEHLEVALLQTLTMLSDMFGVLPSFSYFREEGRPNARASSRDLVGNRADGTVLLGLKLVEELLQIEDYGDAAIVAVCAHEFGHILSYANGMITQLRADEAQNPYRAEQFADFMAGYFAGRRKKERPDFPAVIFADVLSSYGGGDHGNTVQRGEAVEQGFLRAFYADEQPIAAATSALAFALDRRLS